MECVLRACLRSSRLVDVAFTAHSRSTVGFLLPLGELKAAPSNFGVRTRVRPFNSGRKLTFRGKIDVVRGHDERKVRKRLWEVADQATKLRVVLLGEKPEVIP